MRPYDAAEVTVDAGTCQITVKPGIAITALHTGRDIRRHKVLENQPG